ncbi:putative C1orf159-like protein, partial [Naja naja]
MRGRAAAGPPGLQIPGKSGRPRVRKPRYVRRDRSLASSTTSTTLSSETRVSNVPAIESPRKRLSRESATGASRLPCDEGTRSSRRETGTLTRWVSFRRERERDVSGDPDGMPNLVALVAKHLQKVSLLRTLRFLRLGLRPPSRRGTDHLEEMAMLQGKLKCHILGVVCAFFGNKMALKMLSGGGAVSLKMRARLLESTLPFSCCCNFFFFFDRGLKLRAALPFFERPDRLVLPFLIFLTPKKDPARFPLLLRAHSLKLSKGRAKKPRHFKFPPSESFFNSSFNWALWFQDKLAKDLKSSGAHSCTVLFFQLHPDRTAPSVEGGNVFALSLERVKFFFSFFE